MMIACVYPYNTHYYNYSLIIFTMGPKKLRKKTIDKIDQRFMFLAQFNYPSMMHDILCILMLAFTDFRKFSSGISSIRIRASDSLASILEDLPFVLLGLFDDVTLWPLAAVISYLFIIFYLIFFN